MRGPSEEQRLEVIRAKYAAHQAIDHQELRLLLELLDRQAAQLERHPMRRLYAEAQADLERVARCEHWRADLLRLVERELRKLASEPRRSESDRQALLRRADRIEMRLEQREPPEGWSAVGIPGHEWRADPDGDSERQE
jgi:hypothetical protein